MKLRYLPLYCVLMLIARNSFAQAPLEFVENKGQWNNWFQFKTTVKGGDVCLERDGFRYILGDPDNNQKLDMYHHGKTSIKPILKFHQYKVTFENAGTPIIKGENPQKVYYNYFLGNDPSRWKSGIHPYASVNYTRLYEGIDMHVMSAKGNIEYEFFVHPQGNASQIKLRFEGQTEIKIEDHNLVVNTTVGHVTELKPYAYQYINSDKVEVPCEYNLEGNELTFDFPRGYDHTQQLIIDPTIVFCTMTGSTADNWGYTATFDDTGNFYAGGLVNTLAYAGGGAFPVTPGAFQTTFGGGTGTGSVASVDSTYACDISIIKYNPTGTSRIYATYLGGSGNERPHSMIVDQGGNLIIAGRTRSHDYPITPGAYQTVNKGGWDIVVTKLNSSGTALVGSTYVGGTGNDGVNFDSTELGYGELKFNYGDDARSEVQVDRNGNIYVAGCSSSTDFPVTPATAISTTLSGMQDGVVIKLNPTLTSLVWSTYLGGSGSDAAYVLAFDTSQTSLYVAGGTNSSNFPSTPGTLHPLALGGGADGFIVKFKNSPPYNLQKGTYVGTSNFDQVYGIQVSGANQVYVMGQSVGGVFPVTAGVYSNPNSCQFVMKLDSNLASDLISTVFGSGSPTFTNISPVAFLVDTCENVYISGWGGGLGLTSASNGLCTGMAVTSDAVQSATDGRDFYFIVLGPGMTTLRYATYYGRNCSLPGQEWEGEHVDGGTSRFSRQGIIYQAICSNCGGAPGTGPFSCAAAFPTTTGVWSAVDSSTNCNEAALKIAFNIGPVVASIVAGPSTSGCAPLTVNFTNLSNNGLSFLWDFGDGSPTVTTYSPTHTFTASGVFTVTLAAANSNACFRTDDTAYLVITVDTNVITPAFNIARIDSCGPYIAAFTNFSTDHTGTPFYHWDFGDGGVDTGANPANHTYADTGTYVVTLTMYDAGACVSPVTISHVVSFYSIDVSASFVIPDSVCLGTTFTPLVTLNNITSTTWSYGNGYTSTSGVPYKYDSVGTYTITLIASNAGACNGGDTLRETIKVLPVPTANFNYTPITPEPNTPTTFANLSKNATRYLWDFGDNLTSTDVNPVHQYSKTGSYKVCLNAYNASSCPSLLCKQALADVQPQLGLPSAFSPNGDGQNEILYVRGAAIESLDLKIYNRWGQLVFETTSKDKGWDGTFNGQPQPIDAYAYVLHATFIDGTSKLMKGNVTLLR